eukprot:CAMPEP_0198297918 /NCGR_PEP_ID=MMETSP1449-20131203/38889_1 /TAXON_ID=420275 /ORGANISM="Attheya septentrionalis, Strain CCMP2084" /LENGTH=38 /DNA_ID= /DNA_START= /DNA_END= /DNA_ORIENTATION=
MNEKGLGGGIPDGMHDSPDLYGEGGLVCIICLAGILDW